MNDSFTCTEEDSAGGEATTGSFDMLTCMEHIHASGFVEFESPHVAEHFACRLRQHLPGVPVRVILVGSECEDADPAWRVAAQLLACVVPPSAKAD
jgi:hypothetical protein